MKKIFVLITVMAFAAAGVMAQSNDSLERLKQQEALLKQQQKEQQELLKQQQKEQEHLQREQQREAQEAMKKEQDRVKREQAKAENEAKAEKRKAAREQKRQERYASWGRSPRLSADPSVGMFANRRMLGYNSYYNSLGVNVGVTFTYHRPIMRRWDFEIGLGYRYSEYAFSHMYTNAEISALYGPASFYDAEKTVGEHTVVLPIKFCRVKKDSHRGVYIGVTPGFNINKIDYMMRYRCEVNVGTERKFFIFAPGTELYFNLVPTFVAGKEKEGRIHELGLRITL